MFIALKYTEKREFSDIHRLGPSKRKAQNALGNPSVLRRLGALELELQAVSDQGYELAIRGFPLGIAHRIPEEALQRVQVPSVPSNFDGVANGPFYPAGRCLEGLGHLGVQHLGDGVAGLRPAVGASRRRRIDCLIRCPVDLLSTGLRL